MNSSEFKRILLRNKWILIIIPLVTAVAIYVLGKKFMEKKYVSDTTLFTGISSSYKIAGDNNAIDNQLYSANALGDFISILNSRGIKEEVAIRLLAHHLMLADPDPMVLNAKDFKFLEKKVPMSARVGLVAPTLNETVIKVRNAYNTDHSGFIYQFINSPKGGIYSLDALGKILAGQVGNSELVKLEYSTSDPAVSFETLTLVNDVFRERHDDLFSKQAHTVIAYFDSTTKTSYARLQAAEQKLLDYSKQHNIADYEQEINTTTTDRSSQATKFGDIEAQYAGAVSQLNAIERQLKDRGMTNLTSQELIQAKDDLSNLNKQLTELEMYGSNDPDNAAKMEKLRHQIAEAGANIRDVTNKLYSTQHSAEGVPITALLDEYTKANLTVAQLRSQMNVMRGQTAGAQSNYTKLVPVGVQLNSLKHDVELAEKDYDAQREGLKQSKLTEENSQLSASHFKVLDPPNFPAEPNSILPVMVVAGMIGAFIVIMGILVARNMLDTSLKSPEMVEKVTGLKVLGVLPFLDAGNERHALEDKIAEDEMARQLLLRFYKKDAARLPFVVGVLSSYSGEGKSIVAASLASNLNTLGIKAMALFPKGQQNGRPTVMTDKSPEHVHLGSNEVSYNPPMGLMNNTVAEVTGKNFYDYSVILVEFPSILEKSYPVSLLQHLDYILLTVKANRKWQKPDINIYDNISKITDAPIEVVLNGVRRDYLEEFVGKPINDREVDGNTQVAVS